MVVVVAAVVVVQRPRTEGEVGAFERLRGCSAAFERSIDELPVDLAVGAVQCDARTWAGLVAVG